MIFKYWTDVEILQIKKKLIIQSIIGHYIQIVQTKEQVNL